MPAQDIIIKLRQHNLLGRGGAAYPTWQKWAAVKEARGKKKYIICNASEGEPNVFKDGFILERYPETVINGIKVALDTFDNSSAYLYLRPAYYQRFSKNLKKLAENLPITLFEKPHLYLAGEETTLLSAIEGKRLEPRQKPPYPPQSGLFGYPTLINNVETFYYVAEIAEDKFKNNRFYSINGAVENCGVYELPVDWSIEKILKETKNYPNFDFFIQNGGGAVGEVLLPKELSRLTAGTGAIVVYSREKTNLTALMKKWAEFFITGNCDKCVPCREGVYRIYEMLENNSLDKNTLSDLLFVLEKTSFCPLGKEASISFRGVTEKLL
ncbi:MAG: hypothetical protein M1150_02445 [Patescibacteria group bacterium]|nr:hypothetical protein [Patescibacteria group bacterium]